MILSRDRLRSSAEAAAGNQRAAFRRRNECDSTDGGQQQRRRLGETICLDDGFSRRIDPSDAASLDRLIYVCERATPKGRAAAALQQAVRGWSANTRSWRRMDASGANGIL